MNVIREINRINERELELGGDGTKASWHDDYKDSAYVFVGGLPFELTEGDVITIMSQFGEVVDINMPRDKETGKPKGFAFVMYEDQRSTVLAVDNLTGGKVLGRTIRVDHVKDYKQPGKRNEDGEFQEPEQPSMNALPPVIGGQSPAVLHTIRSAALTVPVSPDSDGSSSSSDAAEEDEEDPMAAYIRAERKKQKSSKRKKSKGGDEGDEPESKEARRARKAAKRAKKAEKKARAERAGAEEDDKPRVKREADRSDSEERKPRIREASRRSRSRSPRRLTIKREPSEDNVKPSRADLSRSQRQEARPRDDDRRWEHGRRRSRTPPFAKETIQREQRSPRYDDARRHDAAYPERYDSRDRDRDRDRDRHRYRDRSPRRSDRHPSRDGSPRRDDRSFDRGRTDQDWRSGRHHEDPREGHRSEGDYASWRGRREVERVMRRVGGERDESREKRR
ncbi:hypothetical protein NliqN6_5748 [Naganishia liquefaciens]|uniref:RRM domain-containing protein n=1 Tax=Naganishia liquefaciens TaxID=104408 RepID=A0A8H3TYR0_9TREE|nr:hypothetical protein NliqN6_5748 [Naganishia liquefaciens]